MKPLSPSKFLKSSILKILPMTITVCLGVAVLYFMGMFVQQMDAQMNKTVLYPMRNTSIIYSGQSGIKSEDIKRIESSFDSSEYIYSQYSDVNFYGVVGSSSTLLTLVEKNNVSKLMETLDLSLVNGRLPQQPMEVVVHKLLAANHGLKVGSVVEKGQRGWRMEGDVTIVGLLEGEPILSLGIQESSLLTPETPNISVIFPFEIGKLEEVNEFLQSNFASGYNLMTYDMVLSLMNNIMGSLDAIKMFVGIVLVLVLGVFLSNITFIQYSVRKKELETLHAIGYTRRFIVKKALVEIGISAIIGYLCGITLAIAICWIINVLSWSEMGLALPLFSLKTMLLMLVVPLAITLISMIAPLRMMRFRDIA